MYMVNLPNFHTDISYMMIILLYLQTIKITKSHMLPVDVQTLVCIVVVFMLLFLILKNLNSVVRVF